MILFAECKQGNKRDYNHRTINRLSATDFIKDIPTNKEGRHKGELDGVYLHIKSEASKLKLDSLELGYDSLQLRIWLGHSMAIIRHTIILKRQVGTGRESW